MDIENLRLLCTVITLKKTLMSTFTLPVVRKTRNHVVLFKRVVFPKDIFVFASYFSEERKRFF